MGCCKDDWRRGVAEGMTEQPAKGPLLRVDFDTMVHVWVGDSLTRFDGPNREANAALFIRAQHMDELVKTGTEFAKNIEASAKEAFNSADGSWPADWKENAPDEYKLHSRFSAILAKIEGEKR